MPAVIYGHGKPARSICLEEMELNRFLAPSVDDSDSSTSGDKASTATVMIKKLQRDLSRGRMLHVDFRRYLCLRLSLYLCLVITGLPKNDGAVVEQLLNRFQNQS